MEFPTLDILDGLPITVLGAGTLGRRIAMMYATHGAEVRLYDPKNKVAEAGAAWALEHLPGILGGIEGGTPGKIIPSNNFSRAIEDAWLVTEAVPEDLELKRTIFGELDRQTAPGAILASNSSSFPSSRFVTGLTNPERVLNTHFMMPPEASPVELMSCGLTDPEIIANLYRTLPRWGFSPYVAESESVGFIFNRIWAAIKREALCVLADGVASPSTIDAIYQEATGARVGPFRLMDNVGLDVALNIEEHYRRERPELSGKAADVLDRYVRRGNLGAKSGTGFYDDYSKGPDNAY